MPAKHQTISPSTTPPVKLEKLGRYNADGMYLKGKVYIDPRLKGKERLTVYVHELLHHRYPHWTEEFVTREAEYISGFLWKNGYRKEPNKLDIQP